MVEEKIIILHLDGNIETLAVKDRMELPRTICQIVGGPIKMTQVDKLNTDVFLAYVVLCQQKTEFTAPSKLNALATGLSVKMPLQPKVPMFGDVVIAVQTQFMLAGLIDAENVAASLRKANVTIISVLIPPGKEGEIDGQG